MHVIFWEYVPKEGLEGQFERAYGPMGSWGALFSRSGDYKGTELLKDPSGRRYWTIDRWTSRETHQQFIARHREKYEQIDRECADLTDSEKELGRFDVVA